MNLRGYLYVIGGAASFVASNVFLAHDWRSWSALLFGLVGNTCILLRAYLDQSHAKYDAGKLITELEPPTPIPVTVTNTPTDPVNVTENK